MRALLTILIILVFTSCGTRKKRIEATVRAEFISMMKTYTQKELTRTTVMYGDTLSGTTFIPSTGEPQSFEAESGGVKLSGEATPVYDQDGNQLGTQFNYNAQAKPKGLTNESSKETNQTESENRQALDAEEKRVDQIDRPTVSGYLMETLLGIALAAVILLFVWSKIKKYVKNL